MQLKAYSIRDSKSEVFHTPFFQKTHGEAERSFKKLTNDPSTDVNKYPEDFDLYYIGEYDDNTGKWTPEDSPKHIIKAVQIKDILN